MELKKYKLGDICDIIAGGDAPLNVTPEKTETNIIPVYSNGIVKEGLYGYTDKARITTKAFTVSARGTIGVSFLRNQPFFPIVRLLSVIPNSNDIDLDYLYYYSKLLRFEKDGSVQQQLTVPMLSNIEVRLLPYSTQCKVASILSTLDHKIALNRAINRNLEALAKQLYDYWFVQFDFPDEKGRPYKSSGGKMVWNEKLNRRIPERWHCGNLFEIASFTNGIACQKFRPKQGEASLPVIKIKEMHDGITADTELVTSQIPESVKVYNGDVLFSWSASLEVMLWAFGDGGLNQHIFKVTSANGFPKSFYYYQLLDYVEVFKKMAEARKTTMGHITQDHLQQSTIAIPDDLSVANRFESKISPIFKQIVKIQEEIASLTRQRDELLPLLMNGQVTIE